jgi:hypothetical protein
LRRPGARLALACAVLALGGCVGLGAQRVGVDRGDYTQRLRESEKAQLLSNIVALRYGDAPLFLSVTSVISQYTLETSGGLRITLSPPVDSETGEANAAVVLRETPTVTYTPMSGERFSHSLLAPIPPVSLLAMMEAGWASDQLFRLAVRSFNGIDNVSLAPLFAHDADPRFGPLTAALRRLQRSGAISVRMREHDKAFSAVVRLATNLTPAQQGDLETLRAQMGFTFAGRELTIVFSSNAGAAGEVAVATRSMFEVLQEMSQCVDLTGGDRFPADPLLRIHSGAAAPAHAHVAVQHRGRWFWIAEDDEPSKQAFLLAQVLMSLSDDTSAAHAPLVTIPAG